MMHHFGGTTHPIDENFIPTVGWRTILVEQRTQMVGQRTQLMKISPPRWDDTPFWWNNAPNC